MMLCTAAMRSTIETRKPLTLGGANSLMNRAVASASGKAMRIATRATVAVPASTAAIPSVSLSGCHWVSVKNRNP